jgi:hypothetical protein
VGHSFVKAPILTTSDQTQKEAQEHKRTQKANKSGIFATDTTTSHKTNTSKQHKTRHSTPKIAYNQRKPQKTSKHTPEPLKATKAKI